ncbi:MAG: hypothetical protein FWD43_05380, partial [Coriobacteriia bacterium]|nr:hypothetical protein [Coriobacteriia bacterium]
MAQRNPMNDRYQGEGPAGKSRKSAASAKPKAEAAASVFIEKKPETPRERKAAQKRRAAEKQRKEQERLRRTKEKERAARIAAGLEVEPEKKKSFLESLISPRSQPASSVSDTKAGAPSQKATGPQATAQKPAASQATAQKPATSQTTGQKTASARATAPKATSASATTSITTSSAQDAEPQKTGFFGRMQNPNQPQTPEFKKLRRIYWILMGIALVAV